MKFNSGYFALFIGVFFISFSPLAVKVVSFSPEVSAFYRTFYASLFFIIIYLFSKYKSQTIHINKNKIVNEKSKEILNRKWLLLSIIAGVFLGIDFIFWHKTIVYLGSGPSTFLGNSQIVFVTIFAVFFAKERVNKKFYVILFVIMIGLYFLVPTNSVLLSRPIGYFLGLIVGFTYAGMLIAMRYAKAFAKDNYPEILSLFYMFLFSSITIAFYVLVIKHESLILWDIKSHFLIALTALVCQTIGWYFINKNITKIPSYEGSLILVLQPILSTVWGVLFFHESIFFTQMIGIFLTLLGIIVYQLKDVIFRAK